MTDKTIYLKDAHGTEFGVDCDYDYTAPYPGCDIEPPQGPTVDLRACNIQDSSGIELNMIDLFSDDVIGIIKVKIAEGEEI